MSMRGLYLLALLATLCVAFSPGEYDHRQELQLDRFEVFWNVDLENEEINMAVRAHEEDAWVGFGVAEFTTGAMPGADIIMLNFGPNGEPQITDRHALTFSEPVIDKCQDWELVGGEQGDGYTTFHVKRKFDTGDTQDRKLVEGENRVIWGIGPSNDIRYKHPSDSDHRGSTVVSFWGEPTPWNDTDPNVSTYEMTMPGVTIPSDKITTYMCQSLVLPEVSEAHIIRIDPIVQKSSEGIVHHFLVHLCEPTSYWQKYTKAQRCSSPLGDLDSGCTQLLFAWAVGGGSLYVPEEAGFLMGTKDPHAATHVIVEVHYDNRKLTPNMIDNSGVKIHYTPEKRKYDAAMITLGDFAASLPSIPPKQQYIEYELDCPSECTKNWPHDIHVFADGLHMHEVGSQMWSTHHRGDEYLGIFNRADFYEFDWQQLATLDKIIKPGDRINTHCAYNTMSRSTPTKFGIDSTDEMCMEFISYYPAMKNDKTEPIVWCGYLKTGASSNGTICGTINDVIADHNPTKKDVPGTGYYDFGEPCITTKTVTLPPSSEEWYRKSGMEGALIAIIVVFALTIVALVVVTVIKIRRNSLGNQYNQL